MWQDNSIFIPKQSFLNFVQSPKWKLKELNDSFEGFVQLSQYVDRF